jgi:hypothetical protein
MFTTGMNVIDVVLRIESIEFANLDLARTEGSQAIWAKRNAISDVMYSRPGRNRERKERRERRAMFQINRVSPK